MYMYTIYMYIVYKLNSGSEGSTWFRNPRTVVMYVRSVGF